MTVSAKWAEALKINPEKLAEWSDASPSDTPFTVWCLLQGHIHSEDYLSWACENFGLAILDANYFQEVFDLQHFVMTRQDSRWSPWCFPVGVWEDSTFVVCVEPPAENLDESLVYLLCDPQVMNDIWNATSTNIRFAPKPVKPLAAIDAPVGINLNATNTFQLNLDQLASDEPIEAVATAEPEKEPTLSVIHEAPAVPEIPEVTISDRTLTPASKKVAPVPARAPSPARTAVASNEEPELKSGFERLKPTYPGAIVMRCLENAVVPYKWDGEVKIADSARASVNLTTPSFFRIVAKTMQVYHGYVVDSPIHSEFFHGLGLKQNPACVSAVPLKVNGVLWGILVAFGPESAQAPEALNKCQAVAEKWVSTLGESWVNVA